MTNFDDIMRHWRRVAYEIHRINGGTFNVSPETANHEYPTVTPLMAADFGPVMLRYHVAKNHAEIRKAAVLIEYVFLLQQRDIADILSDNAQMLVDMAEIKAEPISRTEKLYKMARYFYEK